MSNKRVKESDIESITSQLEQLRIDYENNRNKLLKKRNKLIVEKSSKKQLDQVNPFKIGQRVIICNNYSGDYGTNAKGTIGRVTRVTKVQVQLKSETNGRIYSRSFKNLQLIE
jgi:hypothetical protein